ncbi:uncharacterized protein [Dysidea avara]
MEVDPSYELVTAVKEENDNKLMVHSEVCNYECTTDSHPYGVQPESDFTPSQPDEQFQIYGSVQQHSRSSEEANQDLYGPPVDMAPVIPQLNAMGDRVVSEVVQLTEAIKETNKLQATVVELQQTVMGFQYTVCIIFITILMLLLLY